MTHRILIVDDNRIMREMIKRSVAMSGIPVASIAEAANGREALDHIAANPVDLVLLDINMPVMDGEAFLVELRSDPRWRTMNVIVCSSESSLPRIGRFRLLGAGFVHKPFKTEELIAALAKLQSATTGAQP